MALQLSAALGGLPLAVAQVSGYLSTINYTIQEFLEVYHETGHNGDDMLFGLEATDCNYDLTLKTVWDMTMTKLNPKAQSLLRVLAFLDPDNIPEYLVSGSDVRKADSELDFLHSKARFVFHQCPYLSFAC